MSATGNSTVKMLALKFKERSEALGYKGKKRDDAALDYFAGAATVLAEMKHEDANAVIVFMQWDLSIRGYLTLVKLLID